MVAIFIELGLVTRVEGLDGEGILSHQYRGTRWALIYFNARGLHAPASRESGVNAIMDTAE